MKRRHKSGRIARMVLVGAAFAACPQLVRGTAAITFQSGSSFSVTHTPDTAHPAVFKLTTGLIPVSGSMPTPLSYQYGLRTLSNTGGTAVGGGPQSSAAGAIGAYATGLTMGFTLSSGTGITQSDPSPTGANFGGYSELQFNIDATWNINATVGPVLYTDFSLTIGGTIPAGDSSQVAVNLHYVNTVTNGTLANIVDTQTLTSATLLPYAYSNPTPLNPSTLGINARVHVTGTITLRAQDPGAASGLGGILDPSQPIFLDMDAGTPQTWVLNEPALKNSGVATSTFDFDDQTLWTNQMSQSSPIPNGPNARARFIGTLSGTKTVNFTNAEVLGMIDIDDPGLNMQAQPASEGQMDLSTTYGNAVFWVRNVHEFDPVANAAGHTINVPLTLSSDLEVINDAPGPLNFGSIITGNGKITKEGMGPVGLNSENFYTGGTEIDAGVLNANVDGALGMGGVVLAGGFLNINTANPFNGTGQTVQVQSGSQLTVGTADLINGINYSLEVQKLGCLTTSSDILHALNGGAGGNLTLDKGAMIGHSTYDSLSTAIRPMGVATSDLANYTYGLSTNVNTVSSDVTVGNGTSGLWGGFGGDMFSRTFGSLGDNGHLNISGSANLDSLGSQLVINVPIASVAGTGQPAITKRGPGLVAIESNNNTFTGALGVESGPLAIDGNWAGSSIAVGTSGFSASLGGTGTIHEGPTGNSTVIIGANGELHPGVYGNVATFVGTGGFAGGTSTGSTTTIEGPGTLHTDSLALFGGAQLWFNLNQDPLPSGSGNDFVDINGNLTLNGTSILNLIEGTEFDSNGTYVLMHFSGSRLGSGSIELADNFASDTGMTVTIEPDNQLGGEDVVLLPLGALVPEPGPGMLLMGASPLLLIRRRKQIICRAS